MGSQAVYNAQKEAPNTIVVRVRGGWWYVAQQCGAEQPDQFGGGRGPVVLIYKTIGRPYARGEAAAISDAALTLRREEGEL